MGWGAADINGSSRPSRTLMVNVITTGIDRVLPPDSESNSSRPKIINGGLSTDLVINTPSFVVASNTISFHSRP